MPFNPNFPLAPFNPLSSLLNPASLRITFRPQLPADNRGGLSGGPDDWVTPTSVPGRDSYLDGSIATRGQNVDGGLSDPWLAPTTTSVLNPYAAGRTAPSQAAVDDGFPDDWIVPATAADPSFRGGGSALAADVFPDDWIGPPQLEGRGSFGDGLGLPWASGQPVGRSGAYAVAQPSSSAPAVPVSYRAPASPSPWWNPPGAPGRIFDPWADQFIKGMQGLIDFYFRSRQGGGGGGGDPDAPGCREEWDDARRQCAKWLSQPNPPRGPTGSYRNVEDCARGLVSEGCGGNPTGR